MPVQCLTYAQKQIVERFTVNEILNQTELAMDFHVSRRTIQRVLIEAGLLVYNTKSAPEKPSAKVLDDVEMLTLLRQYGMTPATLENALCRTNHV
jgi:DNA-binding XRE family transcriptional regulator